MANPLQHFQLRVHNTPGTKTLYENVFSWSFGAARTGYEKVEEQSLLVGQFKHDAPPNATAIIPFFNVNAIPNVSDIQIVIDRVEEMGGELVYAKFNCPVLGSDYAIIKGPEDCLFGVYNKT